MTQSTGLLLPPWPRIHVALRHHCDLGRLGTGLRCVCWVRQHDVLGRLGDIQGFLATLKLAYVVV